jgi:hypothetical protein
LRSGLGLDTGEKCTRPTRPPLPQQRQPRSWHVTPALAPGASVASARCEAISSCNRGLLRRENTVSQRHNHIPLRCGQCIIRPQSIPACVPVANGHNLPGRQYHLLGEIVIVPARCFELWKYVGAAGVGFVYVPLQSESGMKPKTPARNGKFIAESQADLSRSSRSIAVA